MKRKYLPLLLLSLLTCIHLSFSPNLHAQKASESALEDALDYYEAQLKESWKEDKITPGINDPWEGYNRWMFNFNNKVFEYVLEPVSKGYDAIVPNEVQSSVDNFFTNVRTPVRFFNCLFQGKFKGAATEFGRLVINSSIGVGGFFDPAASQFDLQVQDEDFGQTLGHYGKETGAYIVWPILGPSSVRDSIGFIVDMAFNPATWFYIYDVVDPEAVLTGVSATGRLNSFSYRIRDPYRDVLDTALDPYVAIQDAYSQARKSKISE